MPGFEPQVAMVGVFEADDKPICHHASVPFHGRKYKDVKLWEKIFDVKKWLKRWERKLWEL